METLKVGIQSSGIHSFSMNSLRFVLGHFPLEILPFPDENIPQYVENGLVDIGIVAESIFLETKKSVNMVKRLVYEIYIISTSGETYPVDNLFCPEDQIEVMISNKFLSKEKQDILNKFLITITNLLFEKFWSEFPEVSH